MPDREKVIKGLAELKETIRTAKPNSFVSGGFCALNMKRLDNAIELLKKQETVELPPEKKIAHWVFGNTRGHSWMKCSECCVSQSGQTGCWTYCPNCGAEMKGDTEVEID